MDLNDSHEDAAFRQRVRAFLDANLPPGWGTPAYVMPRGDAYLALLRDWQRRLSEAGFLALAWPKEWGGRGASPAQVAIFNEETAWRDAPQPPNVAGVMLAGPVIYSYGTEQQKRRYLGPILACEEVVVPGLFGTGRRLRPGLAADPRGIDWRPLHRQRPEGLDLLRASGGLVPAAGAHRSRRAQASRPERRAGGHEIPRRRGQAAAAHDGRDRVQRVVFQ